MDAAEPATKRARLQRSQQPERRSAGSAFPDITGLWAVSDPEDRCHLFRWRQAPDGRSFEGVQIGFEATSDGCIEAGAIRWRTTGRIWHGQLDPTGWCIRDGFYTCPAGKRLGTFAAIRQREVQPDEQLPQVSGDRSKMEFQDWADGLFFSLDRDGKEQLLDADGLQVMMEWEKPYMEKCVDELKVTSDTDVLEVGFGCGYSASRIQEFKPRSHTIIECSEVVLERLKHWAADKPNVHIVEGTWQQRLPELGRFDRIFFDDYGQPGISDKEMFQNCPNEQYKDIYDESQSHFHAFLNLAFQFHSRNGTRVSGYLVSPIDFQRDDVDVKFEKYAVAPPDHCDYFFSDKAVVPVFCKMSAPSDGGSTRSPSPAGAFDMEPSERKMPGLLHTEPFEVCAE